MMAGTGGVSLEEALADSELGSYFDRPVIRTSIKLTKAGDGLSKALGIAPQVLEPGKTVMVLVECTVGPHTHAPIPDTECFALIQTLEAGVATIVGDKASERKLRLQANAIDRAREQAKGIARIPGTEDVIDGQADNEGDDNEGDDNQSE